jgi:hypothetical protein
MDTDDFKLGKLQARFDTRTLQFKKLLIKKNLPDLPLSFDVDLLINNPKDNFMFANDKYGCCVISGQAHLSLRFESFEQGEIISITDDDVTHQYFYESGGEDTGLNMLDALKIWRKEGWYAGGKPYNIYGFAQVDPNNHDNVKYAIYLLRGIYIGLALPMSAQDQSIWDVDYTSKGESGTWGGHCVSIKAYNEIGPICITWGREQQMTWEFLDRYCDEAYAIVDNTDSWINPEIDPLNCKIIDQYLHNIASIPPDPDNPNPPQPPVPVPSKPWYQGIVDFFLNLWKSIFK